MSAAHTASQAISVLIPVYNRQHLVRRAVDSVLPQLGAGDEIVVVDDGSTDDTVVALDGYPPQVRVIAAAHGGVAQARNRGVREARNGVLAFLDSDDEWVAGKLELQRSVMAARPDVVISSTDFLAVGPGFETRFGLSEWLRGYPSIGNTLHDHHSLSALCDLPGAPDCRVMLGNFYGLLLVAPCVLTSTVMMRRELAVFP